MDSIQRYNKAYLGGAGAAAGEVVVWLIEILAQVDVPVSVEAAIVVVCAAFAPAVGPSNK